MCDEPPMSRACVLTHPGRGAVAVVAAEGPAAVVAVDPHFHAANGRRLADQPLDRPRFGHWGRDASHGEEVIIIRGAHGVEIHCHGGVAASARILDGLSAAGCCVESWQERLRRTAGDAIEAEALIALAGATTRRTAAILLDQRRGALRKAIEGARQSLADGEGDAARAQLARLLDTAPMGLHLTDPWKLAIAGRPNVGKSSLINALVGYQRAIVFDQPGTTRDVLAAETAVDGWPVRLTDAAGLRAAADPLESAGVELARKTLADAELIVWVLDATALAHGSDAVEVARRQLSEEVPSLAGVAKLLVVVNKIDLASSGNRGAAVPVSALTGQGIGALLDALSQHFAPRPTAPGEPMIFTHRQFELLTAAHAALPGSIAQAICSCDR